VTVVERDEKDRRARALSYPPDRVIFRRFGFLVRSPTVTVVARDKLERSHCDRGFDDQL